jgi:hypothetical protein
MPAIERDSLSFHYLDEGHPSGRPFVFQHGLGGGVPQPAGIESSPDIPIMTPLQSLQKPI